MRLLWAVACASIAAATGIASVVAQEAQRTATVTVRDRQGRPVADAVVRFESHREGRSRSWSPPPPIVEPWTRTARANSDGVAVARLGAGGCKIHVTRSGFVPHSDRIGSANEVTVVLDAAALLSGRVIDRATFKPVAGARVRCLPSRIDRGELRDVETFGESTTDASGAFRFDTVAPNFLSVLRTEVEGFAPSHVDVRAGEAGATVTALVQLDVPATLDGIVLGPGAKPLRGARVWVVARSASVARRESTRWPWICWGLADADAEVVTDERGRFRAEKLGRNTSYAVYALFGVDETESAQQRPLSLLLTDVRPGEAKDLELLLTTVPRAFVRVLDAQRAPIRDQRVITYIDDHGQYLSKTDLGGWAQAAPELPGLRRGKVTVRVIVPNRGQGDVEVDMTDGADGRGEVVLTE